MRITEAAQRLDTSPRMLRYRDLLGLLPPVREPAAAGRRGIIPDAGRAPGRAGRRPTGAGPTGARPGGTGRAGAGRATAGRAGAGRAGRHRQFGEDDLAAVSLALEIEQRYDISPAALAFGVRVLTEPGARAGSGRIRPVRRASSATSARTPGSASTRRPNASAAGLMS